MLKPQKEVDGAVLRGVSANLLSVLVAQVITFGSTAIVTRIYAPSEFGLYANLISLIMIATPICNLGLPSALCYARTDRDANILWNVAFLASLVGAIAIGVIGAGWAQLANVNLLYPLIVGGGVFFTTLNHIQTQWAFRANDLRSRSASLVFGSALVATGKIVGGILVPSAFSLAVAQWFNGIAASLIIRKKGLRSRHKTLSRGRRVYIATLSRYSEFLSYAGPWRLAKYTFSATPVLIVSYFAGLESAGQFALAFTVVSAPMIILSDAITDAIRRPIVNAFERSESEGRKLVAKITVRMPLLGFPPAIVLFLGGEQLFDLAFGSGWATAASLSRWIVLWLCLHFVVQPMTAAFPIRGLQRQLLSLEVSFGLFRVAIIAVCLLFVNNLELAVALYSAVGIFMSALVARKYIRSFDINSSVAAFSPMNSSNI